jgi:hypothetical protein
MVHGDLLKTSRWLAIGAIGFASLATIIAYFSIVSIEVMTRPFMGIGVLLWVLSVIWFMWGWLRNANEDSNEGKGVVASTYILIFLPLCYCFLMATDEARTRISIKVRNDWKPVHSVKIYGKGSLFLNQDTLKLPGLAKSEETEYYIKASINPDRQLEGEVVMEYFQGAAKKSVVIAGPFKTSGQWELRQNWEFSLSEEKVK